MKHFTGLEHRINRLLATLDPPRAPREWHILMAEGEELAANLEKHIGPYDTLIVDLASSGYFGDPDPTYRQHISCWIGNGSNRRSLVIYADEADEP